MKEKTKWILVLDLSSKIEVNRHHRNGPYVCLRQTSKFHHQAPFARRILCICTLCARIFFSNLLPREFFCTKLGNFTISNRGLVVKFAHLTKTRIRAGAYEPSDRVLIRAIHHFHIDHNAPCLPPKLCKTIVSIFSWVVPREIDDNAYPKFWVVHNVHFIIYRSFFFQFMWNRLLKCQNVK